MSNEDQKKLLLEKIQEVFPVPEEKSTLIVKSLFRFKRIVLEKEVNHLLSLTLINKILEMLNQNETYFNQYYLFSILDLPANIFVQINEFLVSVSKSNHSSSENK